MRFPMDSIEPPLLSSLLRQNPSAHDYVVVDAILVFLHLRRVSGPSRGTILVVATDSLVSATG